MLPHAARLPQRRMLLTLWLAGGTLTAACATRSSPLPAPAATGVPSDPCRVAGDSARDADTVVVAATDSAFEPALYRQRLATPVRVDCEGRRLPELATGWSPDVSGRFWTLVLETSAAELRDAWRTRAAVLRWAGIESLVPLDDHRLVVGFAQRADSLPRVLADTALGVPRSRAPRPVLVVAPPASDPRDQLDRAVDLVQTEDPALLDYARQRGDRSILRLPWSRTYLLLIPAGGDGVGNVVGADSAAFRHDLARDAVRADARGAEPPYWWEPAAGCGPPRPAASAEHSGVVVYPLDDRIARDLAQRIVALSPARDLTARGLDQAEFAAALHAGGERAYVMAVPRHSLLPCRESTNWPAGSAVIPLVDVRSSLIARRHAPALTTDWDGAIRAPGAPAVPGGSP